MQYRSAILIVIVMLFAACDGRLIAAGNLTVTLVPCVLLWVTVNLRKTR